MSFMKYQPDIVESIDFLSKQHQQKRQICDEFLYILKERAELEEYYSRNLEIQAESLGKIIAGKDTIKDIIFCLRNYFIIQAEQSRTFARSVKNDVMNCIQEIIENQQQQLKQKQEQGRIHEKVINSYMNKFDELRQSYLKTANQLNQQSKISGKINEDQYQQKQQIEEDFKTFINQHNDYIDKYFQEYAKNTDDFIQFEISRRESIKDSIMKFLVYQVSLIRNLQYDIDRISSRIETIDSKQGIIENVISNSSRSQNKPLLTKLNFDNYKYFMNFTLSGQPGSAELQNAQSNNSVDFQKNNQQLLQNGGNQQQRNLKNNKINQQDANIYQQIIKKALSGQEVTIIDIENLQSFMKTASDRDHFTIEFINIYFNIQNQLVQQYNEKQNQQQMQLQQQQQQQQSNQTSQQQNQQQKQVNTNSAQKSQQLQYKYEIEINSDAYTQMMKLLYMFFDKCNQVNDINGILNLYTISKKIFKLIQLPNDEVLIHEKIYLNQGLQGHSLFFKDVFWEEYIKYLIQVALKEFKKYQQEQAMGSNNSQNEITEKQYLEQYLKSQINILFLFDLEKEKIQKIIKKVQSIYQSEPLEEIIGYMNKQDQTKILQQHLEEFINKKNLQHKFQFIPQQINNAVKQQQQQVDQQKQKREKKLIFEHLQQDKEKQISNINSNGIVQDKIQINAEVKEPSEYKMDDQSKNQQQLENQQQSSLQQPNNNNNQNVNFYESESNNQEYFE